MDNLNVEFAAVASFTFHDQHNRMKRNEKRLRSQITRHIYATTLSDSIKHKSTRDTYRHPDINQSIIPDKSLPPNIGQTLNPIIT